MTTKDHALQLDLFADSRDVMLRNDLILALQGHDVAASRAAQAALRAEYPDDPLIEAAGELLQALDGPPAAPWNLAASCRARAALGGPVEAAARQVLGPGAGSWMRPLWSRLAQAVFGQSYRADDAEGHAAALWTRARDWARVQEAVQTIESWRRIPAPLAWMTLARWHLEGPDAAWPLLAELAWLAPARFAEVAAALPDAALARLLRRFESDIDFGDAPAAWAWLPAWALIEQPLLAEPMAGAEAWRQTDPERAWQLMQALLRLERQGRHAEVIEHRRSLHALNAGLFAAYMRSR